MLSYVAHIKFIRAWALVCASLVQPVFSSPELLLQPINPHMNIPSWPVYSDAFSFY